MMVSLAVLLLVWQRSLPLLLRVLFSAVNSVPLLVAWSDASSWFGLTPHILSPVLYWLLPPSGSLGLVLAVHWATARRAVTPAAEAEEADPSPASLRRAYASEVQRRMGKYL